MTPESIKAQIALRGWKQSDVAKRVGCSEVELSYMIAGERTYDRFRGRFAALFGMSKEEMFDAEFEAVVAYRKSA